MELTGLVNSITVSTANIDFGRKAYAVRGKAEEARISYETGIAEAMTVFLEAQTTADPQTIILAEYAFLAQELQLCEKNDKDTISSLTNALQSFDDAFLAIKAVEGLCYQAVELAIPHIGKYRINGYPKDSFHIACISHRTRLKNILRSPGIDQIEKALLKQRLSNLTTAQNSYIDKQKRATG